MSDKASELATTLAATFSAALTKESLRSWGRQRREHRAERLDFVLRMVEEKKVILKSTIQATAWCDLAIDDLICGDAQGLRGYAAFMEFEGEDPAYREPMRPLYTNFRQLCLDAADSVAAAEMALHRDMNKDTVTS